MFTVWYRKNSLVSIAHFSVHNNYTGVNFYMTHSFILSISSILCPLFKETELNWNMVTILYQSKCATVCAQCETQSSVSLCISFTWQFLIVIISNLKGFWFRIVWAQAKHLDQFQKHLTAHCSPTANPVLQYWPCKDNSRRQKLKTMKGTFTSYNFKLL